VAALLAEEAGLSPQAATEVGYAEMIAHLRGELSDDRAVEQIKINTRRLAKKQHTWHRRFEDVCWLDVGPDETPAKTADRILEAISFDALHHGP